MYNVYTTSLVSYAEVQNVTPYHLLRFLDIIAKHVVHATIDHGGTCVYDLLNLVMCF